MTHAQGYAVCRSADHEMPCPNRFHAEREKAYLKRFSEAFKEELLKQEVIHADETVLQVNREPGRKATE